MVGMGNGKWGVGMMIWIWIWHTFSAFVFWPFIYAVAFYLFVIQVFAL